MKPGIVDITDHCITTKKMDTRHWNTEEYDIRIYKNYNSDILPFDISVICVRRVMVLKDDSPSMKVYICDLNEGDQREYFYNIGMFKHLKDKLIENKLFTLEDFFECEWIDVLSDKGRIKPKTVLEALQIYGS